MMRVPVAVAAFLLAAGVTRADPTTQKRADELFAEGRKLIEKHDDAAACDKFNDAIKLDPDAAGTMLNLGLCNQNLKKYRLALYWYRKAQVRAHETSLPEYEQAAGQRTTDLAGLVAIIKVQVAAGSDADAHVSIDGEDISPADYLHIEIDPGHHTLDATARGFEPSHQEFDVAGKGGQTIEVSLTATNPRAARRRPALLVASAGGALLIASGVISLVAHHNYVKCTSGGQLAISPSCPKQTEAEAVAYANDQQQLARWVATPIGAGGLVLLGVAAYVYYSAPTVERVDRAALIPTVSSDGFGLAAVGRF